MKLFKTMLLALPIILSGCGGGGGSSSNDSLPETPKTKNPKAFDLLLKDQVTPKIYTAKEQLGIAFGELRKGCAEQGGTFNERTQTCLCPDTAEGLPQFYTTKAANQDILAQKPQCYVAPSTFRDGENFFNSIKNHSDPNLKSTFVVKFRKSQKKDKPYLLDAARALDKRHPNVFFSPNFANSLDNAETTLHVDHDWAKAVPPYDFETIKTVTKVWDRYRLNEKDRTRFDFHLYALYFDSIAGIMGPKRKGDLGFDFPKILNGHPDAEAFGRLEAATAVLNDYLNGGRMFQESFSHEVQILTAGCHIRCFASSSFRLNGHDYRYERMYLYGTVVYSRLMEYSGDLKATGMSFSTMAVFGKGNGISAFLINKRDVNDLSTGWQMTMYDEKLVQPSRFAGTLFLSPHILERNLQIDNPRMPSTAPVVILASGLDYRDPGLFKWLKKGPHRSIDYARGSAIGWWEPLMVDNYGYQYSKFYDGFYLNDYSTPKGYNDNYLNQVARHVVGFHTQTGDVSFVPFSNDRKLEHGGELYKAIEKTGARIILALDQQQVDAKTSCSKNNTVLDPKYLFIIQAGYGGRDNPDGACLANLETGPNRIVVGSGGLVMADWSDRGDNFADIAYYSSHAQKDTSNVPGGEGQSFAAAQVAHVAAQLTKKYGKDLSNQHIRMAILLSAVVERADWHNASRTGGYFHPENAARAAKYMADVINGKIDLPSDLSREQLMARIVEASESFPDKSRIANQVKRLVSKGI